RSSPWRPAGRLPPCGSPPPTRCFRSCFLLKTGFLKRGVAVRRCAPRVSNGSRSLTGEPTTTGTSVATHLLHGRRRVPQVRANGLNQQFQRGTLLPRLSLVRARTHATLDDHTVALVQGLDHVLRHRPPHAGPQERRLAVLPPVAVLHARVLRDREVRDRLARVRELQLRVSGQRPHDRHLDLASHQLSSSCSSSCPIASSAASTSFSRKRRCLPKVL